MKMTSRGIFFTFIMIIIGALLIGGATVALFTSTAKNTLNSFQSGILEIQLDRDPDDFYFELTNIAPGDKGSQPVIISNAGDLDLEYQISYTLTGELTKGQHPLQIQFHDKDNLPINLSLKRRLDSGQEDLTTITWEMPLEAGNEYQSGTATFDLLINATQLTVQGSSNASRYVFRDLSVSDFQTSGNWSQNDQGFRSNFGLLFIPNNQTSYTMIANNILHEGLYSNGTSGGYGLLFETTISLDGSENGYILQFDRGYGAITIRRRINGRDTSPIIRVDHRHFDFIPVDKNHPWWSQEHLVELKVDQPVSGQALKIVRVSINHVVIIDNLQIDGVSQGVSHVGLRAWHANSTFSELSIQ